MVGAKFKVFALSANTSSIELLQNRTLDRWNSEKFIALTKGLRRECGHSQLHCKFV